jgi:hypothetical protein
MTGCRCRVDRGAAGVHLAVPVEKHTLFDEQRGGVDVPLDASRAVNLNRTFRRDIAVHGPLNDDRSNGDLGIDLRTFANDEHIIGEDLSGQLPIHANGALK